MNQSATKQHLLSLHDVLGDIAVAEPGLLSFLEEAWFHLRQVSPSCFKRLVPTIVTDLATLVYDEAFTELDEVALRSPGRVAEVLGHYSGKLTYNVHLQLRGLIPESSYLRVIGRAYVRVRIGLFEGYPCPSNSQRPSNTHVALKDLYGIDEATEKLALLSSLVERELERTGSVDWYGVDWRKIQPEFLRTYPMTGTIATERFLAETRDMHRLSREERLHLIVRIQAQIAEECERIDE